jgi:tetratricopeptide (TPR) repeat protein
VAAARGADRTRRGRAGDGEQAGPGRRGRRGFGGGVESTTPAEASSEATTSDAPASEAPASEAPTSEVEQAPAAPAGEPSIAEELAADAIEEVGSGVWDADVVFVVEDKPRASSGTPPPPPPNASLRERPVVKPRVFPRLEEAQDEQHIALDFLALAREAADRGESQKAAETLQKALGQLGSKPTTAAHRRLRVLAQIELGRLQWQAAGPELGFTLSQALATLDAVRSEIDAADANDLAAELCQVIAGVCFDLGDMGSLARALDELAIAGRLLEAVGDTTRVARLLNEQAAVLMRMGETSRAKDLLRESRKVFQDRRTDDPVTVRELAETDHLTAWLPLYATMVAGREQDGYRLGHERAVAAEKAYRQLSDQRELARVWETMGRLERHMKRYDEATQHLAAAAETQKRLGDLTGLARSTEALSEVLALCGREAEAVGLLRDSVQWNRDKGSLIGLFFNRRAFTDLVVRLAGQSAHTAALGELAVQLGTAERQVELGRSRALAGL